MTRKRVNGSQHTLRSHKTAHSIQSSVPSFTRDDPLIFNHCFKLRLITSQCLIELFLLDLDDSPKLSTAVPRLCHRAPQQTPSDLFRCQESYDIASTVIVMMAKVRWAIWNLPKGTSSSTSWVRLVSTFPVGVELLVCPKTYGGSLRGLWKTTQMVECDCVRHDCIPPFFVSFSWSGQRLFSFWLSDANVKYARLLSGLLYAFDESA